MAARIGRLLYSATATPATQLLSNSATKIEAKGPQALHIGPCALAGPSPTLAALAEGQPGRSS